MKLDLSIIICTRNRADSLRTTLESINQTIIPRGMSIELLVVDNGSTDHTKVVVEEAQRHNVRLRYVRESTPGVAHAKNTGLRETSGDIILFTDDDLRFPPSWIAGMCRPIQNNEADAVAGGVVFPPHIDEMLMASPLRSMRSWVAATTELDPVRPHRMVGANMAFHRRVLARVPGFDVELGPGALGFNEETLFSRQLLIAGYIIQGALDTAVEHHFDTSRLTQKGILDMAKKMGRSRAFVFHHWENRKSRFIFLHFIKSYVQQLGLHTFARLSGRHSLTTALRVILIEEEQSFAREYLRQRKRAPKYSKCGLVALPQKPESHPRSKALVS